MEPVTLVAENLRGALKLMLKLGKLDWLKARERALLVLVQPTSARSGLLPWPVGK
jgi:hypothetical protein